MKHGFVRSLGCALSGVVAAVRKERNLKIHLGFALVVPTLAAALGSTATELAILVLAIAGVVSAELMNSALESAVDLITAGKHPLAKTAKDMAAGAVLVFAAGAAAIGLMILAPKILALLGRG